MSCEGERRIIPAFLGPSSVPTLGPAPVPPSPPSLQPPGPAPSHQATPSSPNLWPVSPGPALQLRGTAPTLGPSPQAVVPSQPGHAPRPTQATPLPWPCPPSAGPFSFSTHSFSIHFVISNSSLSFSLLPSTSLPIRPPLSFYCFPNPFVFPQMVKGGGGGERGEEHVTGVAVTWAPRDTLDDVASVRSAILWQCAYKHAFPII